MDKQVYLRRLAKCGEHMVHLGMDVLLLTKPSNMFYLTGDGLLCAFAMITKDGKVVLGVPVTDIEVIFGPVLTRSPAVIRGQESNHLKAICHCNQLSLYVNDQLVAQAADSDFQGGNVGLLASTGDHAGVEIHFTHFVVTQP